MDDLDESRELSLEVVYRDVDVLKLEAVIGAGQWRGRVRVFTVAPDITAFAAAIEQFAVGAATSAEFEAGLHPNMSQIGLRFYRVDRRGHIACHARLVSAELPADHRPEQISQLAIEVSVEEWAVVQFGRQLAELARTEAGRVSLPIERET